MSLDSGDIHVRRDGPREAPPLLLIHGSGTSARSWDSLVPLLTASHQVIRVDLLGHGRSAKPATGDYTIPTQGRRVAAVLDRLDIDSATVIGHSSGGLAATALAEQQPALVRALVLINTGPQLDAFITTELSIGPDQWPDLTDEQILRAMASAFSRVGYEPPHQLIDDVRAMTFHSFTTTMQASLSYLDRETLPDRLREVGVRLLVIFGAEDRRWQAASAADYRVVPGTRVELLAGLGHSPMLEDPERTAALILDFI